MHVEIYMEDWKDLVHFATTAKYQIFSETITDGVAYRLWFAAQQEGFPAVTVFIATISKDELDSLNEVGDVPNGKIVRGSIEVIHE